MQKSIKKIVSGENIDNFIQNKCQKLKYTKKMCKNKH